MDYLPTDANFVEIDKKKAHELSQAGFFVIGIKEGHITTLFPNGELFLINDDEAYTRVVQAGAYVGKDRYLHKIWPSAKFVGVKTYVYLGYILQ